MRQARKRTARLARVRGRQQDIAAAKFATRQRELVAAQSAVEEAIRALAEMPPGSKTSPWELERLGDVHAFRARALRRAQVAAQAALGELQEARVASERAKELHRRAIDEARRYVQTAEQKESDDRSGHGGRRR